MAYTEQEKDFWRRAAEQVIWAMKFLDRIKLSDIAKWMGSPDNFPEGESKKFVLDIGKDIVAANNLLARDMKILKKGDAQKFNELAGHLLSAKEKIENAPAIIPSACKIFLNNVLDRSIRICRSADKTKLVSFM